MSTVLEPLSVTFAVQNVNLRSMAIKVFVITRFNVYFSEANFAKDKSGRTTRTDEWLEKRFQLFEHYCLPSLKVQTDKDFDWLVLFSENTPAPFKKRIDEWVRELPLLKPIYLYDGEAIKGRMITEVKQRAGQGDTHVITARIDNDDAFHRNMISRIRAEFHGQDNEFLNFPDGVQLDIDQGVITRVRKLSNPFMARVERINDPGFATVVDGSHKDAEARGLIRNVDGPPAWLQVIHDGNQVNSLVVDNILFDLDLKGEFGIERSVPVDKMRAFGIMVRNFLVDRPRRVAGKLKRSILG